MVFKIFRPQNLSKSQPDILINFILIKKCIHLYNYITIQLYNYIKWKTIKLQNAIIEALYIREIKSGLSTQEELRNHKLIIKV